MNKNNIFITFGIFIISYIVYIRIILVRLPKELPTQPDLLQYVSYSLIASIFVYLFIYTSYRLYQKYSNKTSTKESFFIHWFKHHIFNLVLDWYYNSLKAFDDYVKHTLLGKDLGQWLKTFGSSITSRVTRKSNKFLVVYLLFDIFPKYVILLVFTLDVCYFHEFHYTYKLAWVLLIPLLYKYIVFTYKEFSEHNIIGMATDVFVVKYKDGTHMTIEEVIIYILEEDFTKRFKVYYVELTDELKQICYDNGGDITATIDYHSKAFILFATIRSYVELLTLVQAKYNLLLNFIRYGIYSILWIYILIYIGIVFIDVITLLEIFNDMEEPFSVTSIVNHE
jgi:hypothetical protein